MTILENPTLVPVQMTPLPLSPPCTGLGELFFGPDKERPGRRARRETLAKACCEECPQMQACREQARTNREHGIWGGETEEERALAGFAPASASRRAVLEAKLAFEKANP